MKRRLLVTLASQTPTPRVYCCEHLSEGWGSVLNRKQIIRVPEMYRNPIFMAVLLISLAPLVSNAYLFGTPRKLAGGGNSAANSTQTSPPPSPVSISGGAAVGNYSQVQAGSSGPEPPSVPVAKETCDMVSDRCRDQKNMTACLPHAGSDSKGSFLLIQNHGESSISVNVTIFPFNNTYNEIEIPKHEVHKINISTDVGGGLSILVNAGNGDCVIHTGPRVPQGYFYNKFPSYAAYMTPVNGAYLLFVTAVVIGGMWTCCKLGKRRRHLDGIPYQELEMGQPEPHSSTNVETAEGWDQDWDDDWNEEKAVRPPDGNHAGNGQANGHITRPSNIDGWRNDWND